MAKGMGWLHGKGVSLWLGKPWASSVPCFFPSSSAKDVLVPSGIAQLRIILELQSLQLDYFFPLSVYAAPAASTVLCFRPGTGETLSISQKEPMGRTAPGSCLCQGFFPFL